MSGRHVGLAGAPNGDRPRAVFVVADNAAIARFAKVWADNFARTGQLHRVRLVGQATLDPDRLVAEAVSLQAGSVLVAGGAQPLRAGQAVATALGLPLVVQADANPVADR